MWFSCFFHQKEQEKEEEEGEIHSMANYEHYICKPQTILGSLMRVVITQGSLEIQAEAQEWTMKSAGKTQWNELLLWGECKRHYGSAKCRQASSAEHLCGGSKDHHLDTAGGQAMPRALLLPTGLAERNASQGSAELSASAQQGKSHREGQLHATVGWVSLPTLINLQVL